ncbi:MAG: DNA-binding protein HU [Candidatus Portnoybacteria bacterium RIFCSPHIGHO2_02_FULL_39_12]|uniref:DNA-binding protein HU n=1 Tax=Candidatus Portnoybacteria bacterium RIFCSPHIGHO2_12_FULL_38_9 TaxID=1801997 RepID=A0A1G2FEH3_9BACT|nr:MAG: DNA-binding protein HU [Candidatus Portnoybacteria bacterium RIFCSPHIGHO2_02_FULL_39_12]OGZ36449.1 MAG: DNA-binding protein HU [Candidatus Portnoybacteria bacterium RIFCSPHIGHO2_12_FULL_38_9]OGZ38144.1 MAG: DNA-binding protein HU [Candidatus Portnoybacteria bacterium RIFCSPLOWO2_01_FULL_38_39]
MTKDELIEAIASHCDSKKQASEVVNAVLDAITKALSKGDKVALTGFGVFSISNRAARTGVNPRTGEKIKIAATKVPKFKAGKALKDAVK